MMNRIVARSSLVFPLAVCLLAGMMFPGCSSSTTESATESSASTEAPASTGEGEAAKQPSSDPAEVSFEPPVFEADAEKLLASRLPIDRTTQGWI
ncbi:MAG: hypothetical protein ACF8AM_03915 [Rhodopirellula sp. JB055]|uniref:hypothetical protein n=1 Tax=Rhodopirellula sp. JB055 TaxID=3342846 RepID=UPI00370CE381